MIQCSYCPRLINDEDGEETYRSDLWMHLGHWCRGVRSAIVVLARASIKIPAGASRYKMSALDPALSVEE